MSMLLHHATLREHHAILGTYIVTNSLFGSPRMLKETDGGDLRVPLGIYPSKTDQIDIVLGHSPFTPMTNH